VRQAGAGYRVPRQHQRYEFSPDAEPVLRVPSGSRVTLETLDCFSNRLTAPGQRYAREADLLELIGAYNPVTGPVYVEGAEPGDVLAVAFEEITLGTAAPFAATLTFGSGSAYVSAECPGLPPAGDTKICPIESGPAGPQVIFPAAGGDLRLPPGRWRAPSAPRPPPGRSRRWATRPATAATSTARWSPPARCCACR
jgi:amidase